jgi:hypothetical protein
MRTLIQYSKLASSLKPMVCKHLEKSCNMEDFISLSGQLIFLVNLILNMTKTFPWYIFICTENQLQLHSFT